MAGKCVIEERISFGPTEVPYHFGATLADHSASLLAALAPSQILVVVDAAVSRFYTAHYERTWQAVAPTAHFVVEARESAKTMAMLARLLDWAAEQRADRSAIVVAMGGGIVGNIAGLFSHLLLRGVRLFHVPTTHVAAFDSVLSIKQAVNVNGIKNFAGAYHQPVAILCDVDVFAMIDARDLRAGLAETIKNALVAAPDQIDMLLALDPVVDRFGLAEHTALWRASLAAKCPLLALDGHERRQALIFEYGHTSGHAIEAAAQGGLRHGEAVAVGLTIAAEVARRMGHLPGETVALHRDLVGRFSLPTRIPREIGLDTLRHLLLRDNKRGYLRLGESDAPMVLLRGLGDPIYTGDLPLCAVPRDLLESAVADSLA